MTEDWKYRVMLLGIVGGAAGVALVYRLRVKHAPMETIDYRAEGPGVRPLIRFSAIALWLTTLGYLLWPPSVAWAQLEIPTWVRWLGALCSLPSLMLMVFSLRALGKNLTDTVVVRRQAYLVSWGPYRWVRHPYYLAAGGLVFSTALLSANLAIGVAGVLLMGTIIYRVRIEEAYLQDRFGEAFDAYRRQTGAFWPRHMRGIAESRRQLDQEAGTTLDGSGRAKD